MTKPIARFTVSVDAATKAVIDDLSELMDTSVTKLAGSLLDDSRPHLEHLRDSIRSAKDNPGTSYTTMHLALIEAQRHALEAQADFLEQIAKAKAKD